MNEVGSAAWQRRVLDPNFVRWLALFVLAGASIYLASVVWSGLDAVAEAFGHIGLAALLLATTVAGLSFLIRFGRWHLLLGSSNARVPVRVNLGIYFSGLALTASPGKAGELVRSLLLMPFGVPAKRSLAAFLADRLSDVVGVCLLGAAAGWIGGAPTPWLSVAMVVVLAGSFAFRWLVRSPALWPRIASFMARHGLRAGIIGGDALAEWARLWSPARVVLYTLLACAAYGLQALMFAGLCHALGMTLPVARAVEIFASATLMGAASGLPGGLGAMEAAMVVQLMHQGTSSAVAVTAAIALRLVTLWFGVLIGLGSLMCVVARLQTLSKTQKE